MDDELAAEHEEARIAYLRAIGHPAYADPVLQVGESKLVIIGGKEYVMTRTQ